MFDLCCILLALQTEFLLNKFISEFGPVFIRKSDSMGIQISGCAAEFSHEWNLNQEFYLVLNSFYKHHHFLAQSGGRGGLAMCPRQHRDIAPFTGQDAQLFLQI